MDKELLKDLVYVLEEAEYSGEDMDSDRPPLCAVCGQYQDHKPNCLLKKCLDRLNMLVVEPLTNKEGK